MINCMLAGSVEAFLERSVSPETAGRIQKVDLH